MGDPEVHWEVAVQDVPASVLGTPFPGRPGHVTGTCGHPVPEDEWDAGHRECEDC